MINKIKSIVYQSRFYELYDRYKTFNLRKGISDNGLKSICEFDYTSYVSSDTVFILGSGGSIMDLSEEDWTVVKNHNSIGFNSWILHDFVPTYYAIESSKNKVIATSRINLLNSRKLDYVNTPVFIQYQHMLMAGIDYSGLELPEKNVFYNAPFMPNTTSRKVLKKIINRWVGKKDANLCDLMHYSSSLSYMIGLGYLMGYKKIVLLGIDLDKADYFFENETANQRSKEFAKMYQEEIRKKFNLDKEGSHTTVSKAVTSGYGCLPIDVFIEELKEGLNSTGVELFIGNKKSRLYPLLPLYKF